MVIPFIVHTSQLNILLEQKVGTLVQQKWISKFLIYNFCIKYKRGVKNKVADVLSRKENNEESVSLAAITFPIPTWLEELKVA